jgi:hypothetical protein
MRGGELWDKGSEQKAVSEVRAERAARPMEPSWILPHDRGESWQVLELGCSRAEPEL